MKNSISRKTFYLKSFVIFVIIFTNQHKSFTQYLVNGSFEGKVTSFGGNAPVYPADPPTNWRVCDLWSLPVLWDSLTDAHGLKVKPVNGNTFLGLRAYGEISQWDLKGKRDYIVENLSRYLGSNSYYKFSIYVLQRPSYDYNDFDTIEKYPAGPLALELWGGNDNCATQTRLFVTDALITEDETWKNFDIIFNTSNNYFYNIRLQVQWDTVHVHPKPYQGWVNLDYARLVKLCSDQTIYETLYYKGDGKTTLMAYKGIRYDWEPTTNLSAYNIQAPTMTGYNDKYIVNITDIFGCKIIETFNILFNCDSINTIKNKVTLDTLLEKPSEILLTPLEGKIDGSWYPTINLSCTDCQTPIASPQSSTIYSVNLKDEYNCIHQEIFKIKIDITIPNFITPNGDGFNDNFKILGLPEGSEIKIFDKDGALYILCQSL